MRTTSLSVATPRPRNGPASAPGSDPVAEIHRLAARQAGWRVRQAERRLGVMRDRLRGLAPDGLDYASALAEVHRCERALFSRQLELRDACDTLRRLLPCRSTLDPEGWPQETRGSAGRERT